MGEANNRNTQQLDRYSGGRWSEMMERVRRIQEEYEQGGLSEAAKHHKIDELYDARGSLKTAKDLIPLIKAEHQRGVEWGLERLLVSVQRLVDLPYVEPGERQVIERRVTNIIGRIDLGELDTAEAEVRDIEAHVEQLQRASLEAEFASLLSGIGEMYQPMVQ
jgi:hypothetical protein